MNGMPFLRHINWRIPLVRILINAIVLVVIVLAIPYIQFVEPSWLSIVLMATALGVLNALAKPVLQFVFLPLIFASYGLVIVLVNTLLLYLLEFLFPSSFAVDNLLWAFVAGAFIGLSGTFLENLFGLIPPILPDPETGLRRRFREGRFASLGGASVTQGLLKEEQLIIDKPETEQLPVEPGLEPQIPPGVPEAETPGPGLSPDGDSRTESDAPPGPPEGARDAPSSLSGEGPEPPTKEGSKG